MAEHGRAICLNVLAQLHPACHWGEEIGAVQLEPEARRSSGRS